MVCACVTCRLFEFVMRMLATGSNCLPAGGIGALSEQLASRLPADSIYTGMMVFAGVVYNEAAVAGMGIAYVPHLARVLTQHVYVECIHATVNLDASWSVAVLLPARLPADTKVEQVVAGSGSSPAVVKLSGGGSISASKGVVVAVEAPAAAKILGQALQVRVAGNASMSQGSEGVRACGQHAACPYTPCALGLNICHGTNSAHTHDLATGEGLCRRRCAVLRMTAQGLHLSVSFPLHLQLLQASPSKPEAGVGTCNLYFKAPNAPFPDNILYLNGTGKGLVNNCCFPSTVAPSYAPPGQVRQLRVTAASALSGRVLGPLAVSVE